MLATATTARSSATSKIRIVDSSFDDFPRKSLALIILVAKPMAM